MDPVSLMGEMDQMESVALRPGVALPVIGYLVAIVATVLSFVAVTFPGPHNHALFDRWLGGQVLVTGAWAFYKLASNRIVLGEGAMRIVSWGRIWTVRRGEVEEVLLTDEALSLSIILADGLVIRPFMFMASPLGVGYFQAGLFRNSMSREAIAARITEWNAQVPGASPVPAPGRRWRVRLNLRLLLIASAVVAAEAISLTAANIWG
jgi:hypothetical protein